MSSRLVYDISGSKLRDSYLIQLTLFRIGVFFQLHIIKPLLSQVCLQMCVVFLEGSLDGMKTCKII